MSVDWGVEQSGATPPLPRSIWVVAWASLAGQAVLLVRQGGRLGDEISLVVSVVLGALLVGYVSAGVVRARTVRLVLAFVVLTLGMIGGLASLFSVDDLGQMVLAVLSLATAAVALAGLARFRRSDWYAWQRTRPGAQEGASIGRLVAIGLFVGVLGGLSAPVDDGLDVRVKVADLSDVEVRSTARSDSPLDVPLGPVNHVGQSTEGCCGLHLEESNADNGAMNGARLARHDTTWLSSIRVPPAYPRNATDVVSGIA